MVPTPLRRALALAALLAAPSLAQSRLTSPREFFGHEIGADYVLPNYTKFVAYWQKLATESDRMDLDTIGVTAEGRPQLMAIVSSPENLRNRERYRRIAEQLARAEGITAAQARELAREGKGIVWIDGGLHATEVLGAQQLIESNWQLVSGDDPETRRFRDDLIIVMVHANPDGMELVSDWYMRETDPRKRNTNIPRLYQKYIGHDNNRDFYLAAQPESENMNRVLYTEWYPQVMYNHHQTGPAGTVMFAPPFRGLLPQHDRAPHRDHRQPDPDRDPVHREPAAGERRSPAPRAAGRLEVPAVDRVFGHRQPRGARCRLAQP